MSVELSAALWGVVGGTVGGLISGLIVMLVGRSLRHRGKIRSDFDDWRFRYVLEEQHEVDVPPRRRLSPGDAIRAGLRAGRIDPAEQSLGEGARVERATYGFSAHLLNEKDVRVALRDARVVFLSDGREKLTDRPLPVENRKLEDGAIQLSARESATLKVRGMIDGKKLAALTSGWDEVRLQAVREDGSPFDEHVAYVTTSRRKPSA